MDPQKVFDFCTTKNGYCACQKAGTPLCGGLIREAQGADAVAKAKADREERERAKKAKYIKDDEEPRGGSFRDLIHGMPSIDTMMAKAMAEKLSKRPIPMTRERGTETETIIRLRKEVLDFLDYSRAPGDVYQRVGRIFDDAVRAREPVFESFYIETDTKHDFIDPKARRLGGPDAKPYTKFMDDPVKRKVK